MSRLLFEAFLRGQDANGDPVSGARLYVYEAGTTTPVTTYSDSAMTTAHASPVVADSAGYFPQVYVPSGLYKVRVTDASDVVLNEHDNVNQSLIIIADGSASAPALTFTDDPNTGIYRAGVDTLGFAAGGSQQLRVSTSAVVTQVPYLAQVGSPSAPPYSFSTDTDTGIYRAGVDIIGASCGGAETLRIRNDGVLIGTTTEVNLFSGASLNVGVFIAEEDGIAVQRNTGPCASFSKVFGAANNTYQAFYYDGAVVGSVAYNGSGVTFNTTSDPRAKDNIRDLDVDSGKVIDAFRPRAFTMRDTGFDTWGFLTTEYPIASAVSGEPGALDDDGNAVMQQLDASTPAKMAIIIAELQSLRRRVAELEARA